MALKNTSLSLRQLIMSDLDRISVRHRGGLWPLYYVVTIPGFSTAFLHRLSHYFYEKGFWGRHLGHFFWHLNYFLHSCDISPCAEIGTGLFIPHPVGIVIGAAKIGNSFTVYHNTTIGLRAALGGEECRNLYPVVGDDVVLSAGSLVLGPIRVGNKAKVGSNAVVLINVPDDATAVGVPARILSGKN